jgi:hypothetical protein
MENKTLETATKSNDWECTQKVNIGEGSYRVYESKSENQRVVEDGKNDKYHIDFLRTIKH